MQKMQKVGVFLTSIFTFLSAFSSLSIYAATEELSIVSRSEWGADESIQFQDAPEWAVLYQTGSLSLPDPKSAPSRSELIAKELIALDPEIQTPSLRVRSQDGRKFVWTRSYSSRIRNIVVHHTDQAIDPGTSESQAIRSIYRYHTLKRGWGDIGYNYLIGPSGTIYEGRAGGEKVIAAHAKWNNAGSVGIALLGSFSHQPPTSAQTESLSRLIASLALRHGIDLGSEKNIDAYRECATNETCLLKTVSVPLVSGHREVGSTECPGEELAMLLPVITQRSIDLLGGSGSLEQTEGYIRPRAFTQKQSDDLIREPRIRVLLSHTGQTAKVQSFSGAISLQIPGKKRVFIPKKEALHIAKTASGLYTIAYSDVVLSAKSFRINAPILAISSWSRTPSWDGSGKLNDNTFRSVLYFPSYDDLPVKHISIINILPIESYLAGVAEYSNSTKQEKIKTLAISARSYAYSYLGSQRKFDTHLYDASDNPEEFQLYLGYGYEQRSPRARSIVASTKGVILETPLGVPFRSWYSSSAGGQTRSYAQYCLDRGVMNCQDNPHLISVIDSVSAGKNRLGHGVGLTGDGSEHLANLGWSASEILAYYYLDLTLTKKW